MAAPESGFNFTLPWGVIEWALAGISAAGAGVAGWVWHLGSRITELENQNQELSKQLIELGGETKQMQQMMRSLGHEMERKFNEETRRLEGRIEKLTEKLEEVREELPSRQFIEGQLNNLQQRIDRSMDVKMAGRSQ